MNYFLKVNDRFNLYEVINESYLDAISFLLMYLAQDEVVCLDLHEANSCTMLCVCYVQLA